MISCSFQLHGHTRLGARLSVLSLAAMATLGGTSSAWAQASGSLRDVVVTATRSPQLLSATMPNTTVITRADIERSQAPDLVTLLGREVGLQRTQNGGTGATSSLFLRGAPSLQTLVLIDGVPQNRQDASGAVSLEHLMLDNIERVEIVRGNVSAIYGSGAIGGVIQIFTRTGTREPSVQVGLDLGPRATRKLSTQASAQVGNTSISAGVSRYLTSGFSSVNPAQFSNANPDADGYGNTSANLALIHKLTPQHQIGLRVARSDGDTHYDNPYGAPADHQNSSTLLNQYSLFSDSTWGDWRSRVTFSEQSDKSAMNDNGVYGSTNRYRTRVRVLNWVNTLKVGQDWLLTAGADKQWQGVDTSSTSAFLSPYDVKRQAAALFVGLEGAWGRGQIQLNARHDKVGELSKTTGYMGYSHPVTEHVKLIASASTAFNAPPLGYLYSPDYGNPNLKPEQARSHELGAQYEQQGQFLRATYFNTKVKDLLVYDTATFAFANVQRTHNKGLEFSYHGVVGATKLRASLTLQDPVNETTGTSLVRRSKTLWSFGVSQPMGGVVWDADLRRAGSRSDSYSDPATFATKNTTLQGYTLLDLALSYQLRPEWKLRARLDNVANVKYQTVYGYNQQPRSLYVGVTWVPKLRSQPVP